MNPGPPNKYQQAIAAQQAKKAQNAIPDPIPHTSPLTIISTDYTDGAKDRLRGHSIQDAYQRFFAPKDMRGSGDNLLTNCFNTSAHSNGDANPSMDINVRSNVYVCHGCDITGDMVDLAANAAGIVPIGQRCPDNLVHEAVKFGCESLFADMVGKFTNKGGNWQYEPNTFDPSQFASAVVPTSPEPPRLFTSDLEWRDWLPQGTPLRAYMDIVTQDDNPEEFHFFNFIQMIGLILGREVKMGGDYPYVYGNLLMCHIGRTGQGKSRTFAYIRTLLQSRHLQFDESDHTTQGIRIVTGVGSGEVLVDSLGHTTPDLSIVPGQTGQRRLINTSPRSLVIWSEFSNLVAKASQAGSTMGDKVIDMYDLVNPMSAISRQTHSKAHHPYASGVTTTQLDVAQDLFSRNQMESGFINRWLFVIGSRKDYMPFNGQIDINPMLAHIDSLYNWMNNRTKIAGGLLFRNQEADEEARRFLVEVIQPRREEEETASMFARMDLLFKKLILICAANMMASEITIDCVYQAEKIWHFCAESMFKVAEKMTLGSYSDIDNYIISRVEASAIKPDSRGFYGIQPGSLKKGLIKKFKMNPKEADMKLKEMKDDKVIVLMDTRTAEQKQKAGRPVERYLPNSDH